MRAHYLLKPTKRYTPRLLGVEVRGVDTLHEHFECLQISLARQGGSHALCSIQYRVFESATSFATLIWVIKPNVLDGMLGITLPSMGYLHVVVFAVGSGLAVVSPKGSEKTSQHSKDASRQGEREKRDCGGRTPQ